MVDGFDATFRADLDRLDDEVSELSNTVYGGKHTPDQGVVARLAKFEEQQGAMKAIQDSFVREQRAENEAKARRERRRDTWQKIAASFISALLVALIAAVFTLLIGGPM
jgi:hypothetical protein